jgi:hypothetical protein
MIFFYDHRDGCVCGMCVCGMCACVCVCVCVCVDPEFLATSKTKFR